MGAIQIAAEAKDYQSEKNYFRDENDLFNSKNFEAITSI